jgi:hypothetical protein
MNRVKAQSHISQSDALFSFLLSHSFCRRIATPEKKELREIGKQGGKVRKMQKKSGTVIQSISNQDFRTLIIQVFKSPQLILISTAP